ALFVCGITGAGQKADEGAQSSGKNRLLVLPVLFYTPLTKIAVGGGGILYLNSLRDDGNHRPSSLFFDTIFTQKSQVIIEVVPDLYLNRGRFHVSAYAGFKAFTEKFYGVGPDAAQDREESFSYRILKASLVLSRRMGRSLYLGVKSVFDSYKVTSVEAGGLLDAMALKQRGGESVSGLGVVAVLDTRNNIFFPGKGVFLTASGTLFRPSLGSDYRFQKVSFDFREYIPCFSGHVLALQQSLNLASGDVPFHWLNSLGGPMVMRGYIQGRFRDRNSLYVQVAYRFPLIWRLSASGFLGVGDVAPRAGSFRFGKLKLAGGWGLRFRIDQDTGTNIRLDFGFARGSFGVYAMVNEAF
ncbi:MAG: BamA/TamA family outer membrane protein, partial [Candidatus Aminicenantales bacterium]